jgi:Uma2 family endonuclease
LIPRSPGPCLILGHAAELPTAAAEPTIMGMPDLLQPAYWTAEMVRALPDDGQRYEVVHGELLVTPAPRAWHQVLLGRLVLALGQYLEREPVGQLLLGPADLSWDPRTLVQPDLFVVEPGEARTLDWSRMQHLLLVIEILSPSTSRQDRFTKRRRYQEAGVGVYWIVDADQQQVEVWAPDDDTPSMQKELLSWSPAGASASFSLRLSKLFRPL